MNINSRHVLIIGSAAQDLALVAEGLRQRGVTVTLDRADSQDPPSSVTAVIVAEHLPETTEWNAWWDHEGGTRGAFEGALNHLAQTSHGLLVGFSDTRSRSSRKAVRRGMETLITGFHAYAGAAQGTDFSVNGLEVPSAYDVELLTERLEEYALRANMLADEVVVGLDALKRESLVEALTDDIL